MRFCLTLLAFFICLAAPASAVTWKIQVTGSIDSMTFQEVERIDPVTGDFSNVGAITYDIDDSILDTFLNPSYLTALRAATGMSFYVSESNSYENGSGILTTLIGDGFVFGLGDHGASDIGTVSLLTTTEIFYEDDGLYEWVASDGAALSTFTGSTFSGAVTSYSISTVPLPASAFLLAGGLFGLTFLRRKRA